MILFGFSNLKFFTSVKEYLHRFLRLLQTCETVSLDSSFIQIWINKQNTYITQTLYRIKTFFNSGLTKLHFCHSNEYHVIQV